VVLDDSEMNHRTNFWTLELFEKLWFTFCANYRICNPTRLRISKVQH